MNYADFIKGNEGFQYSVNLQYDLNEAKKVNGYIPTKKSIELLYHYLLNTKLKNSDKSTVLIGPYGKGKSHLLLILLNILGNINEKETNVLIKKIKKIDKPCAELIKEIKGEKKFIPIVLNANSMNLNESFLIALKKSLERIEAEDIIPKTYYDAAIDVINGWRAYDNTFELLKKLVSEACRTDVETYIKELKKYNVYSFNIFKDIFKEITSGYEFNPLINTDIVKLYEEVNHILHDKYGYSGMIIVFDEFSKFIEASVNYNTSRDLKILQDFAELANRSDKPQMHLICVTHKTVNEYISKIPQERVDAWRAIEGRFTEVYFNSSAQQNYELIQNAIIKDEDKFKEFWKVHENDYSKYYDSSHSLFKENFNDVEYKEGILKGCFPLSPYSTYALPIISEKVAQNERTLFTFISKVDDNSLLDIIKNNKGEKELVTIDNLYDYFEGLFKKEVFNQEIHEIWLKADTALNHCDSEEEKSVVKALAILYVIKDFKNLPATKENLMRAIGFTSEEITLILKGLKEKNVLMKRKSTGTVDFIPISGVDIEGKIKSLTEAKMKSVDVSGILSEVVDLKCLLPRRYNDEYKMVRYFNRIFMTSKELLAYDNSELLLENKGGDGLLINLIIESEEEKKEVEVWCKAINDSRIVISYPNDMISIREWVSRYSAILTLLKNEELIMEDAVVETQLGIFLEDNITFIQDRIIENYNFKSKYISLIIGGNDVSKEQTSELSEITSKICFNHYSNAPKINNELINKNLISAPLLKARNTMISSLFTGEYKTFDYEGNSVDCTLFRTTLKNKGLLEEREELISEDLRPLIKEIKDFLYSSENKELCFSELYNNIYKNKKEIGARRGILPIYISFIFKDYFNEVIIYLEGRKKKEVALTTEVINNINEHPEKYYLCLERGTEEKDKYINGLSELFSEYKPSRKLENKYVEIVKSMQGWLQSLSKYAKNNEVNVVKNKAVDCSILKFRSSILKFDINNRQFIFNDIKKIFKVKNYVEALDKLKSMKEYLENNDKDLNNYIKDITLEIMNISYKGTLTSALKNWVQSVNDDKTNHIYDLTINGVLECFKSGENNEEKLANNLALSLTGLSLEDWNDSTINKYVSELKRVKDTVENYEVAFDSVDNDGLIKISFIGNDGDSSDKTFDKVEISDMGNMILNNLEAVFEDFADSVEDSEKRSILIKVLEKYI